MAKAEFLEKIGQHWDELQEPHHHDNLCDFEKDYTRIAMAMNREALEALLGKVLRDHRKNKEWNYADRDGQQMGHNEY